MRERITISSYSHRAMTPREVEIIVGKRYRIEPHHNRPNKNRGRTGVVESIDERFFPEFVLLRFDDTKRVSKVDIGSIVLVDEGA